MGLELLGRKLGMTQIFLEDGECIPVTVLGVGPCVVVQKKGEVKKGVAGIQLGFEERKEKHTTKPQRGHFAKAGVGNKRFVYECQVAPDVAEGINVGDSIDLARVDAPRVIVFAYPRTGEPGKPVPHGWDAIPGARGCTPETCGFRDHHDEFLALKGKVFGLSTQTTEYQKEMVDRLHVPFDVLSDQDLSLTRALRLPTFEFAGMTLIKRLTFVVRNGAVEHVFYPVFPPDRHAEEVLGWLRNAPGA